jgi:hypothetical protein
MLFLVELDYVKSGFLCPGGRSKFYTAVHPPDNYPRGATGC